MSKNTSNKFLVGLQDGNINHLRHIPPMLTKSEALNLAAWIVALIDPTGAEFGSLVREIQSQ